jgi:serine/threonine protein kinase
VGYALGITVEDAPGAQVVHRGKHNEVLVLGGDQPTVIKRVRVERQHERALRRRLGRELRALARMHARETHPNIVLATGSVGLDSSRSAGPAELHLRRLHGEALRELVRRDGALDVVRLCDLAIDMVAALGHVHDCGLVHADIKAGNVFACDDGRFVLLDFDLARPPGPVAGGLGTRLYAAPEQARGDVLTSASDVWSLGALLYRCATAGHPFGGLPGRAQLVLQAPRLRARSALPSPLAQCIDAMLDPHAGNRPVLVELDAAARVSCR